MSDKTKLNRHKKKSLPVRIFQNIFHPKLNKVFLFRRTKIESLISEIIKKFQPKNGAPKKKKKKKKLIFGDN